MGSSPAQTLDRALDALSDRHRRSVLIALAEEGTDDVAAATARLADDASTEVVKLRLHHHHLPKLDDLDYVAWDRESGSIDRGSQWGEVAPVLDVPATRDGPVAGD
jgi:hypothetical protein